MNDQVIITIAQAVIKNAEVLQTLIDHLPAATKEAVAQEVQKSAPVQQAPQPQPEPTPAPQPSAPAPQAPPTPEAPVPAPAAPVQQSEAAPAAAPTAQGAPFTDGQGLVKYVMDAYQKMGPTKGAEIQKVLVGLGYGNINDVKPEHYGALYQQIEALKGGA